MERNGSEMISFGAGVNSVAMTIMLVDGGWRGPIVFADPGAEHPDTYCYIEYFERGFLRLRGLAVTVISPVTHTDLYKDRRIGKHAAKSLEEFCLSRGIVPILASRWCSVMFKRTPLVNWQKKRNINKACVGMSASEPQRHRGDPAIRYPLHDITRGECKRIISRAGLEVPMKSGCFFCPGQRLGAWKRLYYDHPDLYARAIALEDNADSNAKTKWATLDPHGISLRQHAKRRWQGQMQMDLSAWLPCMCRL